MNIIFILIGTFVGAGFASGKEVFNFFTIYGWYSFISIFVFSIALFFLIFKCLNIKEKLKLNSYSEFINYLEKKYTFLNSKIFLTIINIFLVSSFYIMVIALSSLFIYQFNIERKISIITTLIVCFVIFYKKNTEFVYKINYILMPILIVFMFFLFCLNINLNNLSNILPINNSNVFVAIFYRTIIF